MCDRDYQVRDSDSAYNIYYNAFAVLAMQTAVIATADLSVRPSVCLSVITTEEQISTT